LIAVNVTEPVIDVPGDSVLLAQILRTSADAEADDDNQFNADDGIFKATANLTAWSENRQRNIGVGTAVRVPIVLNNFTAGWRSVNAAIIDDNHPDFEIDVNDATAFQIKFETTGHENIRFSARQRSTATGPDFFALAYRVGSDGDFIPIPNSERSNRQSPANYIINSYAAFNWQDSQTFDKFVLPDEVENQTAVYLRVYMIESEIPVTGRSNGNTSINDIVIIGDEMDNLIFTFPPLPAINTTTAPALTLADISLPPGYEWDNDTTPVNTGHGQTFPATLTHHS
jgi:hypothetical protein